MWVDRLLGSEEGRARLDEALDELWPYALGVLDEELRPELVRRVEAKLGRAMPDVEPVARGTHEAELAELLEEMTMVRRSAPGGSALVSRPGDGARVESTHAPPTTAAVVATRSRRSPTRRSR